MQDVEMQDGRIRMNMRKDDEGPHYCEAHPQEQASNTPSDKMKYSVRGCVRFSCDWLDDIHFIMDCLSERKGNVYRRLLVLVVS
jgi:hypothetical protein